MSQEVSRKNLVALIGRPNVGKSTLFNRLTRGSRALTHDRPGITRDRMYGEVRREGISFGLVDTGGVNLDTTGDVIEGPSELRGFEREVFTQAKQALQESRLAVLVVDAREGLLPLDEQLASFLRQSGHPVLLVANKVDGSEQEQVLLPDFYALGLDIIPVSAAHRYNMDGLIEKIASVLDSLPEEADTGAVPGTALRLALLGRPNAGKSSLANAMLGQERMIVSDIPGTTRDSVDLALEVQGPDGESKRYVFVDTAGIRRRSKIVDSVEQMSVSGSLKSARKADVSLMVLNAEEGIAVQDKRLLAYLDKEKIPLIILLNKVDLFERKERPKLKQQFRDDLGICRHAPLLLVSAKTGAGLDKILPTAEELWKECDLRVGTGQLNRMMEQCLGKHQPPLVNRRRAKFFYLTQADTRPPTFVFFVNNADLVKDSYARYLEKQLRKLLGLHHAPLDVRFRSSHGQK